MAWCARAQEYGHRAIVQENIGDLKDFDLAITFNIPVKQLHYLERIPKGKLVLVMTEPMLAGDFNFSPKLHELYSSVYTWSDDLIDKKKYFKLMYNSANPMIPDILDFDKKKFCVIICSNNYSTFPGELYSERRRVIDFYENVHPHDLDFYGRLWSKWPAYPSKLYKGFVQNKTDVMKNYKFAICYENSRMNGYISEKIFDCFQAGVVPVYLGAPNIETYIPKACFIAREDFTSDEDVYQFLKKIPRKNYELYLEAIRKYLKSNQAKMFSGEAFNAALDSIISDIPRSKTGSEFDLPCYRTSIFNDAKHVG